MVFHDRNNLDIVYSAFNLSKPAKGLSWKGWLERKKKFTKSQLQITKDALESSQKVKLTVLYVKRYSLI